jgi:putative ABC transport system permease protein
MSGIHKDVRYSVRVLARNPGFTVVALLTLTLGIGANSAIFSVVNTVLLRPLRFPDPGALLMVRELDTRLGGARQITLSTRDFLAYRDRQQVFDPIGAYSGGGANLNAGDHPVAVRSATVSAGLFDALGVAPLMGRTFLPDEEHAGRNQVAIVSYGLWKSYFGSDPNIVGSTPTIDGKSHTIVGVMPADFEFPIWSRRAEMWLPFDVDTTMATLPDAHFLNVVARLKPGVSIDTARADMETLADRLQVEYPASNSQIGSTVVPLHESIAGKTRPALLLLLGAVGVVLLIACANVANLLLARASARRREIAIRAALGASRARVSRQLLIESLVLSLTGGVLGLAAGIVGVRAMVQAAPDDIPLIGQVGVDAGVLAFTFGIAIATGLFFGLFPAIQSGKMNLTESLREGGRTVAVGGSRLRDSLVVAEIALALVVLMGSGLLLKSFILLRRLDPGFRSDHLLIFQTVLPESSYPDAAHISEFYRAALERLGSLPGVESVGAAVCFPLGIQNSWNDQFTIEGRENPPEALRPYASIIPVGGDFFKTMGITLVRGRAFSQYDGQHSQGVAIIDEALASEFFEGEDPIGARINGTGAPLTIVGVVRNVKQYGLDAAAMPSIYLLYEQLPAPLLTSLGRGMAYALHTKTEPLNLASAAQAQILEIDRAEPVSDLETMEQALSHSLGERRFNMLLLAMFALIALVLAAVGIYGVMSYATARRTHEIGVRMALGAKSGDVLRLVVGRGALLTLAGLSLGACAALFATRLMSSMLYGVSAADPVTFAAVSIMLAAVALMGSYLPARKAARIDPNSALRCD